MTTLHRIYCGRNIPETVAQNSSREAFVRDSSLARFVAEVVSKAFPGGFSQTSVEGFWRDTVTGRTITEPTVIFEVVVEDGSKDRVLDIAKAYKSWFSQQAVMVVSIPVNAEFV
jgi:hypothetical protein